MTLKKHFDAASKAGGELKAIGKVPMRGETAVRWGGAELQTRMTE
jgi:hypothetical protein